MDTEQVAQNLFEVYRDAVGGKTVTGATVPEWDQAQASAKSGWRAVAQAAQNLIKEDVVLADNTVMTATGPQVRVDNAQTRNRKVAEAASAGKFEAAKDGGMVLTGAGHDATGVNPNNEERQSQVKQIEAERKAKAAKVAATRAKAQKKSK